MGALPDMSHEWRDVPLPENIACAADCWIQSAHVFGLFRSKRTPGLEMSKGSGLYDQTQLIVGPEGKITLGEYACINSTTLHCEKEIRIGAHCLVSWGVTISDCMPLGPGSLSSLDSDLPPVASSARHVTLQDNVWVGFGAVIMPGVTIGEGAIVAARTVIEQDVPPYVVIAGSPPRIIRDLPRPGTSG